MGIGPFLIGVAGHGARLRRGFGKGARRPFGQPAEAARPWPPGGEHRRETVALRARQALIGVGTAPAVVGDPGAGGAQQQNRGRRCPRRAAQDEEMVFFDPLAAPPSGERDEVTARQPVLGDREGMGDRPAAAGHRAVFGRLVPGAFQAFDQQHRLAGDTVAGDFQVPEGGGGRDPQREPLSRPIAETIRVAPDLQRLRIARRPDIAVVKDVARPAPGIGRRRCRSPAAAARRRHPLRLPPFARPARLRFEKKAPAPWRRGPRFEAPCAGRGG